MLYARPDLAGPVEQDVRAVLTERHGREDFTLTTSTPLLFVALAILVSLLTGLVSGVVPAQRAARLDPIEAQRAE